MCRARSLGCFPRSVCLSPFLPSPTYFDSCRLTPPGCVQILTSQIRSEIASSSERAYPSLPLSSTKSLLFLDSEGAVVEFARARGWAVKDGHIYFPSAQQQEGGGEEEQEKEMSQMVIENTLGYARQLETIV